MLNQHGGKLSLTIIDPPIINNNISKQEKKIYNTDIKEIKEESSNELLSKILDTINSNSLNIFYPDSNNEFKKKIDSLNLKFYLETEKYLSNKNRSEKCQTSLFIILFKQINIYIEEIERLNLLIIKRKYDPKKIMERTDEIIKKQNEFLIKEKIIKALKESQSNMEIKLLESIKNEDKLKKEIQMLKKENESLKKNNHNNTNNNNEDICMTINIQKRKSNNILNKLTYPRFHSSTFKNLINDGNNPAFSNTEKNTDLYYNNKIENGGNNRKRNNSDNNKNNLNNSFIKYEKNGADKLLFKKYLKKKENILNYSNNNKNNSAITNKPKNILNNSQISKFKILNKRKRNNFIYNNKTGKENRNNTNNNNNIVDINSSNNQTIKKPFIYDTYKIRPTKTEHKINDLSEYKKGFLYEYNSSTISNDNQKYKYRNKELLIAKFSTNCKEKKENYFILEKEKENIKNQNNKEKINHPSFNQISIGYGANIKKKQKIKI